jgi:hypothetical protein
LLLSFPNLSSSRIPPNPTRFIADQLSGVLYLVLGAFPAWLPLSLSCGCQRQHNTTNTPKAAQGTLAAQRPHIHFIDVVK